jgi:phosphonate transport system permease protein
MMELKPIHRPFPFGRRSLVLFSLLGVGFVSWFSLGIHFEDLVPTEGGARVVIDFFSHAVQPAFDYESEVPVGTEPLLLQAGKAAWRTLVFASAAMTLSLFIGFLLGFPASTSWWSGTPFLPKAVTSSLYGGTRILITLMRSVHELLWAVLFLSAFGFNTFSAVIAISIPYGGTLAKIFSEMIDEAPRNASGALRMTGGSSLQVFFFGLLPRALPDMMAYAFYRFECAVRSSAILGFFGYQTLGYFIRGSFDNIHFGEAWTYLYTLFFLVFILDAWSGALRKRFLAYE